MSHVLDFLFRPFSVLDSIVLFWLFIKWQEYKSAK
jgi:hypothetical protein